MQVVLSSGTDDAALAADFKKALPDALVSVTHDPIAEPPARPKAWVRDGAKLTDDE
jgi:hypothetical protein